METEIELYKGIHSPYHQEKHQKLQVIFKGSVQAKAELNQKDRELYQQFQVWNVRNRHMVPNLPHYVPINVKTRVP